MLMPYIVIVFCACTTLVDPLGYLAFIEATNVASVVYTAIRFLFAAVETGHQPYQALAPHVSPTAPHRMEKPAGVHRIAPHRMAAFLG